MAKKNSITSKKNDKIMFWINITINIRLFVDENVDTKALSLIWEKVIFGINNIYLFKFSKP